MRHPWSFLPRTLRAQFLVTLLIIGVLPISLAGVTILELNQQSVKEESLRELSGLAHGLAGEIDIYIGGRLEESSALTTLPDIAGMDPLVVKRQLEALFFEFSHIARLAVYDATGSLIASSHQDEPVATTVDSVFSSAVRGQQSWRLVADPSVSHLNLLIDSPIRNSGRAIVGVLRAYVDLADLAIIINRTQTGIGGRAFLIDQTGHALIHPDSAVMQNREKYTWPGLHESRQPGPGTFLYDWSGETYIAAFSSSTNLGWTVIVEQPEQEVLAPVYGSRLIGIGFIALSVILAIVVAILVTRALTNPLSQLVAATRALGVGHLDAPLPAITVQEHEISKLVSSFAEMRNAIADALARERNEKSLSSAVLSSVPTGLMVLTSDFRVLSVNDHAKDLFVGDQTGLAGFSIGTVVADDLRIVSCNAAFSALFGRDPDSLAGARLIDILPSAAPERLAMLLGRTDILPTAIIERDTPTQLLRIYASPVLPVGSDMNVRLLITIEDLTEMTQIKLRYRALETLQRISLSILRSDDLRTTLSSILSEAMHTGPFDTGAVWLSHEGSVGLELYASTGYRNGANIKATLSSSMAAGNDKVEILDNINENTAYEHLHGEDLKVVFVIPVKAQDKTLGIIELGSRASYSAEHNNIELLTAVGNQMGIAAQKARLDEALIRSEAEARLLSLVASRTINAVVIADAQGRVEWVNAGFTRITGYTLSEVIGKSPGDLLQGPESDAKMIDYMRSHLAKGEGFTAEIINYHKSGRKYWVQIEVQPVLHEYGRAIKFMALESDITERKAHEQALALARDQALEASRLKSEFLAMMSHEIRTPMNGIIGMSELLALTPLNDEQQEYLQIVQNEGGVLLDIINDILDFSKIEAGRVLLDPIDFNLSDVLRGVTEMLKLRAQQRGLDLNGEIREGTPEKLIGDVARIKQILVNLASNAVKFTQQGSIDIRIGLIRDNGRLVSIKFEVQDTGIGISGEAQARLFQPFVQADGSVTRRYGGTGLGLAISKRLVELMGGLIGVQSEEGAGSIFWFTLPLERGRDSASYVLTVADTLRRLKTVLLIDDESQRETLSIYLSAWGIENIRCTSINTAINVMHSAIAGGAPIDIVFVDGALLWPDPMTTPAEIARDQTLPRPDYILITDAAQQERLNASSEAGYTLTLAKPLHQSDLYNCLVDISIRHDIGHDLPVDGAQQGMSRRSLDSHHMSAAILVAEDNESNQKVILGMLNKLGYTATVVVNGQEAVDAVTSGERRFDLVFMDVQMPVMDGMSATRKIREWEQTIPAPLHTPVVALTANALAGDAAACFASGMDDYLSKPVSIDRIALVLKQWLPEGAE